MATRKKKTAPSAPTPKVAASSFEPLREQILATAERFEPDAQALSGLLRHLVDDVERASAEPLTILPVAHHSPACGVHIVRRLRARPPKVVFIEMCEDLRTKVDELKDCKLPVALQAFASESEVYPESWLPISLVSPLTEFSAEYQAIAWAMNHKDVEVVFVDRSVDHVFQWIKQEDDALQEMMPDQEEEQDEELLLHASVGLQLGSVEPTFDVFRDFLLENARVQHFTEWWDLYVEQPTLGAPFEVWRQTMILVGSLIRRLGTRDDKIEDHRRRERYMWTRMKQYLAEHEIAPSDAVYICGAAHAASDVEEWGTHTDAVWEIPERTNTEWLFGFIPSSYSGIEHQFAHPRGTLSLAESTWNKALTAFKLKPFSMNAKTKPKKLPKPVQMVLGGEEDVNILSVMTLPPALAAQDQAQLLHWCTQIVDLARKNRYLASTADSIAIYETSVLLAGLRGRRQPSPYDFVDAAVTCLEKMSVPGRRDVRQLCGILLGADRVGQVGYSSLPPLVQDIYDRLAPIGVTPRKSTITRWLADFRDPAIKAMKPISDLLWKLYYLLPSGSSVVRPIMGEKKLGGKQIQESWDVKIHGAQQRVVIQLAYEGVTIEQVLELRLRKKAHRSSATTVDVLALVEDSILFADNPRLTSELGKQAVHLLTQDMGAQNAQAVFDRVRRLVHYYRATPDGLPEWLGEFVSTGYQHYATLLPQAFQDRGTSPEQLAGMLSFLFALESLALSLGCNRSQVMIAVQQAGSITSDHPKLGLLWAAEWLLQIRDGASVRAEFDLIFDNPMSFSAFPAYLGGFILALHFTPLVAPVAVDLIGRAFSDLPDAILLPWLPNLVTSLKEFSYDILPSVFKEAFVSQPRSMSELNTWTPPWLVESASSDASSAAAVGVELSSEESAARGLLFEHRATAACMGAALGAELEWIESLPSGAANTTAVELSPEEASARGLLFAHRAATESMIAALGVESTWVEALQSADSTTGASASDPAVEASRALLEAWPETMKAVALEQ